MIDWMCVGAPGVANGNEVSGDRGGIYGIPLRFDRRLPMGLKCLWQAAGVVTQTDYLGGGYVDRCVGRTRSLDFVYQHPLLKCCVIDLSPRPFVSPSMTYRNICQLNTSLTEASNAVRPND